MKNKPHRHKESNAFRFKSFGDRINEIDIRRNALYHIKHINEESAEDTGGTEFHEAYNKWLVLNLSEEYNEFQKQIRNIVTLPQLIHKKDHVVEILTNALRKATVLSLQPLLEFVVALAKDLRQDFYPYFQSFLNVLVHLLSTKEADQVEWTLICLAQLFKILKPFLKKDITVVFNAIIPLLEDTNPEHISNFAAECFSFVARDIKDKEKFLILILNAVKSHRNGIAGCGKLLVEIVRGVNGQFHNCGKQFLEIWLEALGDPDRYDRDLLYEILIEFINNLLQIIYPANMQAYWDVSYLVLEKFLNQSAIAYETAVHKLLLLIGQTIEARDGRFLTNTTQLVNVMLKVIDSPQISEKCLYCASQIVAVLLMSKSLIITQLDASRIAKKVLSIPSAQIFEAFVWNCVNYSQFEILILPEFIRYFDGKHFSASALELLAKIVMTKSPFCRDGRELLNKTSYQIRFRSEQSLTRIENIILQADSKIEHIQNQTDLIYALIIYPHIIGIDDSKVDNKLSHLIEYCLESFAPLEDGTNCGHNRRLIFLLSLLIETQIKLSAEAKTSSANKVSLKKITKKLLPFCARKDYCYIQALRLLDLVITSEANRTGAAKDAQFNFELFTTIHEKLSDNLSSQYQDIRLLTAHLFDQFSHELKLGESDQSIYSTFYSVELIEPNVHTYREQLLHIQKVEASTKLLASLENIYKPCKYDPLKFLIGFLHVNFSLLWKPVMELIQGYATELDVTEFWSIYKSKLDEVTELLRHNHSEIANDEDFVNFDSFINEKYSKCWENTARNADLINFRIQLWRMIPMFGMLSEIKNREIVTIFLDFINEEYKKSKDYDSFTWNLVRTKVSDSNEDEDATKENENGENMDDEEPDADDDADESKNEKNSPKGTQRTLTAMLQTFTNQTNPKQLHREPELSALYMQLLRHRNSAVQKLALDCIFAYKHKYLTPYKEYLYHLVDDGKFKEAITNFKIDKESNVLQEEHRANLMPVIMNILFSKMLVRVGGQKTTNQMRKSLVMRFLGGCHEHEILILLSMSFWLFETDFDDDAEKMCQNVVRKTDLTKVISPRKLQSCLDLIDVIQVEFSGLMSDQFHKYLLNIILVIGSNIHGILQTSERGNLKISSKMGSTFRSLRNVCIQNLQRFFNHFESYPWTNSEINAIFMVFVTPLVNRFSIDSLTTVSPLLKLFSTFCKFPRLFVLLTRYTDDKNDGMPIKMVMDLLVEPKARPAVCLTIMEMIQSLLTLSDEMLTIGPELNIEHCQPIDDKRVQMIKTSEPLNLGSKILLPYLPKLLQKFKLNIAKRRGLTKRDLVILSKITELITDADTCNTLLTVLLPIFVRKSHSSAGEEALMQMVDTIAHLFEKIKHPEHHIRNIAPMFAQITAVAPRKRLCDLLKTISKRFDGSVEDRKNIETMASVISDLNAWDRRWVEQPDYEKRLNAYKTISELLEANRVDINFGLLVIYHSFYFIKYDKDMGLRDSAAHHLQTIAPALIKKYQRENPIELDYLIGNVILNLVRRTIRDKNDNVRNQGILLLGEMARECPDAHAILGDLHPLTCKQDREIDFFDNITHLQSLRHGRALLRFCTIAKTYEQAPSPRTLTQFILPLASSYLASEKYAAKHGIVTSAIETVGAVCRLLPWHQYEMILKYYLKNMRYNVEYQKQMVRIVMHILDSFHFDLSKAKVTKEEIAVDARKIEQIEIEKAKSTEPEQEDKIEKSEEKQQDETEEEIVIEAEENEDEDLNDGLEKLNEKLVEDEEPVEKPLAKKIKICVYDTPVVLSPSIAKKVIQTITTGLVPTLNHSITAISTFERFHKLNKKKRRSEREEEEILRVPIALAMIKLLQKLPEGMLEYNLPGILIKVCMFLRSPLISVRMTTRDTLKNIMVAVGATYMETLLGHLTSLLTRGFQVHVLTITVHCILDAMKTSLKNGIADKCLQYVLGVCLRDIFGPTAEEKEITKIGKHTPEAKPHNKSFLTLNILATYITESCLLDLLLPFKDILVKSQSKKTIIRVQDCFQKIVAGLNVNKQISVESMLMFIYGTVSESIPDLLPGQEKPTLTALEKEKIRRERPDCFLIPQDPAMHGRSGAVKKALVVNSKTNAHVLVEFGLELLQLALKKGKLLKINYQPFINPIVLILDNSLTSAHIRVTTFSLKCLTIMWNKEIHSEKLTELTSEIADKIFSILHKYVAANTEMSAENFSLVQSAFKTMVSILRNVSSETYNINLDQSRDLLFYIEQYLSVGETTKQTIAFSLLKVILGRKMMLRQLNNVLMQVARLAIQSESELARGESKAIIVNYLIEYPLGKKIQGFIEFFISNLNYEVRSGRESAINILHSIAKRFPPKYLNRIAPLFFVSCGTSLINDESPECRQHIAECIETLLTKITVESRNELFEIVLTMLQDDKKSTHREMGALLSTRFLNAEKQKFEERLPKVFPIIISSLTLSRTGGVKGPGQFVRVVKECTDDNENNVDAEQIERAKDHQLIQLQNTILKIIEVFPSVISKYPQYIDELAYESQKLLAYDHVWVRLNALKCLQIVLHNIDTDEIVKIMLDGIHSYTPEFSYLYCSPASEIRSLTLDLCAQLLPGETDKEVAASVIKNLIMIANILKDLPISKSEDDNNDVNEADNENEGDKRKINLMWLLRRMRYVVHAEVAKTPFIITLRSAVFNWIEGIIHLVSPEIVKKLSHMLLAPLVREMSEEDKNIKAQLRNLAIRVGNAIKEIIGDDEYNILRAQIQKKLMLKRAERRKNLAIEKVRDPERAAHRMKGIKERKKMAKRRNMDAIRNQTGPRKKRKKFNDDDD